MEFELKRPDVFPSGTSVGVYVASAERVGQAPAASAVTTASADGEKVTFTGLNVETAYVAYAQVSTEHRYIRFMTGTPEGVGEFDQLVVAADATVGTDLDVVGDATVGGDVDVTGGVTVGGDVAVTGKVGFNGADPVAAADPIAGASGGSTTDAEARAAINAVLEVLRDVGLVAEESA